MSRNESTQWTGRSRGGSLGHWFFVVTLRYLGVRAAYVLLAFVAPYFLPFAPRATRAMWRYHLHILGLGRLKSAARLFTSYYTFGQTIIDRVAMSHGIVRPYRFVFDNYDELIAHLQADSTIVVGAHVGAWETGAHFFDEYGKHINIVMYDAEYERIKHVVEKGGSRRNYKIIPLNADALESVMRIYNALENKEYVCFQGDRFMDPKNSVELTFMGRRARFPRGLFKLAVRLRVPVVFYFAMREPGRTYRFVFSAARPADGPDALACLMNQYVAALEAVVRKYPHQWFNYYDFWTDYES